MEIPEIGTKFRHPDYPKKVFAFMSQNGKDDKVYWSFIDVNKGTARFFNPEEVIEIVPKGKKVNSDKGNTKNRSPFVPKQKPALEGDEKVITVGGDEITVI